jgi:hypothetical protein
LSTVKVFNVQDCHSMAEFDAYSPGIGVVFQTPVVGHWIDGIEQAKGWGKAGRDLIASAYGVTGEMEECLHQLFSGLVNRPGS